MPYLLAVAVAAGAGYLYMEMAARLTLVSGRSLGALLSSHVLRTALLAAVVFGCAAYQAGNLLGALGGLRLLVPTAPRWIVLPLAIGVAALLWSGGTRRVARLMAGLVALMGLLFVVAALQLLLGGGVNVATTPTLDSAILLGLLGTTIVPYNFFLAAGLGAGAGLGDMRRGLGVSFAVGGLITAAILVVGGAAPSFTSFGDLAEVVSTSLGGYGPLVLGVGLFTAGFSSAATAPLAAALAARELLGLQTDGAGYRAVWLGVLATGTVVATLGMDLLGVILAAQVVNGLLLPLIAAVVLWLANRSSVLGDRVNGGWQNGAGALVLCFMGYKTLQFLYGLVW